MPIADAARPSGRFFAVAALLVSLSAGESSASDGAFMGRGRPDAAADRERTIEEIRKRAVIVEEGTSSSAERRTAVDAVPLGSLSAESRKRVESVLDELSMFRKLPTIAVPADPQLYDYFVVNPDVAVSIWRAMQISTFEMTATGPGMYDASLEDGTEGTVELLYRTPREAVVFCDGSYKPGPLLRPVTAQAVLHLRTEFGRRRDGTLAVRHRLNMFVAFPSQTVETAAKLVSPVSNMLIDRNFRELSLFLHMMTLLSEQRPGTVDALAMKLEGVTETQRESLREVSAAVHERARVRDTPVARVPAPRRTARAND